MNRSTKKIISTLLAVVLALSLAVAASAAEVGTDVAGHAQETALKAFIEKGYLKGYEDGTVRPDGGITRAEFATFVNRVTGYYAKSGDIAKFTDVAKDAWYRDALATALQAGYMIGASETEMNPSGNILAYEADLVVTRILGTESTETSREPLTRAQVVQKLYDNLAGLEGAGLPTEGTVYGTATLTYAEFYAGDVSSTESYDAVSSATNTKSSTLKNTYSDFVSAEKNVDGYHILGVLNVNVAVAGADAAAYKAINPSFTATETVPAQYKTVTVADGKAVYSATNFNVAETVTNATAEIQTGTVWGDYQINVTDPEGKTILRNARNDEGFAVNSNIQGIILETSEGYKVGAEALQNIWVQPYEVSWNVSKDNSHNTHIAGQDNLGEFDKLEGATITKITYIMPDSAYVYDLSSQNLYAKPVYANAVYGTVSATGDSFTLLNVPEVKNGTLTVTYTVGSGRQAQRTKLYEGAVAGTVALSAAEGEGAYSAVITSDDYANISVELVGETVYALITVPFDTFYKAVGIQNDVAVDAVSSATTGKVRNCKNVYFADEPTVENGTDVLGVVAPVKMTSEWFAQFISYGYVMGTVNEPAVYLVNDGESDGNLKLAGEATTESGIASEFTSSTKYGDYQLNLADSNKGFAPEDVYGMYLTADDGTQYALRQAENLWRPNGYYQFAWSTGVKTVESHSCPLQPAHYASMEGKKLTAVTYITKNGVVTYELAEAQYVAPHLAGGEITAEPAGANTVKVTVPDALQDVKVTIAVNVKRGATVASEAALVNGAVTLDGENTLTAGTEYTVTVFSSNYAALTTTFTYGG